MASRSESFGGESSDDMVVAERLDETARLDNDVEMSTVSTHELLEVPAVVVNSPSRHEVTPRSTPTSPVSVRQGHSRSEKDEDVNMGDNIVLLSPSKTSEESVASTASSASSVICRICHMSEKETGETLGRTECECRGGLESVHRSCLIQWVSYKRNNRCELCGVIFPSVSPPLRPSSAERQRRRIEAVYQQYTQLRPMTRRKRAVLGSLSLFLVITTSATGVLTVSTERNFQRIHLDPWSSGQERMDSYVSFSICLSFLLFCATLTVGVLLIWLFLEGSYYRRRERFYNFANQIASRALANGSHENTV